MATPADPSPSDCPPATKAASPSREITDAIEGMVGNYTNLVRWLETFEKTDARELIGFDVAMVICGCYNIAIRGLSDSVERLLSECKTVETLHDIPRADDIVQCCALLCVDNTASEVLDKIVGDHSPRYDELRTLADRLRRGEYPKCISGIRDDVSERFEALKDAIVQLAAIVNDTNAELAREQTRCRQLEQEKINIVSTLTAKEEDHTSVIEIMTRNSTSRIDELAKQLEDQETMTNRLTLCHRKEKQEWDTTKTQLMSELDKTKAAMRKEKIQFDTVQAETEDVRIRQKHDIDILSQRIDQLRQENEALLRAQASERETLHNEYTMAQQTIARLEETVKATAADSATQLQSLVMLHKELESTKDELDFNRDLATKMNRYDVTLNTLSQMLAVDLKQIAPADIFRVIIAEVVNSASWIETLLMRLCVARGDTLLDEIPESQANGDVFRTYEDVITAAMRRLNEEQSPMDVTASVSRTPSKRKLVVAVYHGKKKHNPSKTEPSPTAKTTPTSIDYTVKPDDISNLRVVKTESTQRGECFTLPKYKLEDARTVAVSNHIVTMVIDVLRQHAGSVMLVDLGIDSPLSSLHQLLLSDSTTDYVSSPGALCHCSDVDSLAKMCECALLICWSRSGSCELYGMEYGDKAMYVVIIVDTGLGSTRHYYVLSCNVNGNKYMYNLVSLTAGLVSKLPQSILFKHTTSGCRGPPGDLDDKVTHFASVAVTDIVLDVSQ